MGNKDSPFQVAIFLYPGVTALDAVGPWEVSSRMPNTEVRLVGKETGPVLAEGGVLLLGVTHTLPETVSPDLLLVPGGATTSSEMVDDEVHDWLRKVHETTAWTTSVCSGALILRAAGILKGLPATTHWYKLGVLKSWAQKPETTSVSRDAARSRDGMVTAFFIGLVTIRLEAFITPKNLRYRWGNCPWMIDHAVPRLCTILCTFKKNGHPLEVAVSV